MTKKKVLVFFDRASNLGGPTVSMKKLMDSPLQEKYDFIPYYFLDHLGKVLRIHVIRRMVREIKRMDPDIIYFSGLQLQGFYIAVSCKLAGYAKKAIVVVRGSSTDALGASRLFYFIFGHILEPFTLRIAAVTHTVCADMAKRPMLQKNMRRFGGVVYNMAPLAHKNTPPVARESLGLQTDAVVLIYTGRLVDDKGIPYLLEAVAQTSHSQQLLLVGDGGDRERYEQRCCELGIADRVHFLGYREDVFALLAASDIFVFPTLHENLSNALLEAGTMSLPFIATNVGGNPEVIDDGVEGILVPIRDSQALAEAIEDLTIHPDKRKAMGANAYRKMEEKFAPDIILKQIDELFESV